MRPTVACQAWMLLAAWVRRIIIWSSTHASRAPLIRSTSASACSASAKRRVNNEMVLLRPSQ